MEDLTKINEDQITVDSADIEKSQAKKRSRNDK